MIPSPCVLACNSSAERFERCAATASAPYSTKLPLSNRSSMLTLAVRNPSAYRLATASARAPSDRNFMRDVNSVISRWPSSKPLTTAATSASSNDTNASPPASSAPSLTCIKVTRPSIGARKSWRIFINSVVKTTVPAVTRSPTTTWISATSAAFSARKIAILFSQSFLLNTLRNPTCLKQSQTYRQKSTPCNCTAPTTQV